MDGKRFDDLTEALASGTSRRRVLKLLGGGLATSFAASLGMRGIAQARGNSECAALCKELFPPGKERGQCISQGARGMGPCADPVEDPCANVDCSERDKGCIVGVCNGGVCQDAAGNDSGACFTFSGADGTCSAGQCKPNDPCSEIDCSVFDTDCTTAYCNGGVCSEGPSNETGACTTDANEAGTCTSGTCVANDVDVCADVDCSWLNNDCNTSVCDEFGMCSTTSTNEAGPCTTDDDLPGTCSQGTCEAAVICPSGVTCNGKCCVNTGDSPLMLCSGGPPEQCTCYRHVGGGAFESYFC